MPLTPILWGKWRQESLGLAGAGGETGVQVQVQRGWAGDDWGHWSKRIKIQLDRRNKDLFVCLLHGTVTKVSNYA